MSFSRHTKIYQSDGLKRELNWSFNSPTDHRSDESSTGYSFMGCSPAEPMSASPVPHSFSLNPAAVQSTAANRNLSLISLSQQRGPHQAGCPLSRFLFTSEPSHSIPAKCAKMDARCANCERHLAFLP